MSSNPIKGTPPSTDDKTLYALYLTPEQARVAQHALELYARLHIGQFNRITELVLDVKGDVDEYCRRRDIANPLLKVVAGVIFGTNFYGEPNVLKNREHHISWNIYHVLRYKMAWHENPKGGIGVCYDKPYDYGGYGIPKCEIVSAEEQEEAK